MVGMVAYALSEGLATKDDVRELNSGLMALENKVAALDSKIGALNSKFEALDAKIDTGLNNVTQKLIIYLGGIILGAVTLLEVLNRIFPVVPAP